MPNQVFTKQLIGQLNSKKIFNSSPYGQLVHNFMRIKANETYEHIAGFIKKSDEVLDIGLGSGTFASLLKDKEYNVTGVDVANLSLYKDIQPVIYDGKKLPFEKNQFDVATIISVLHHCGLKDENKRVLAEAMRVSKRVILIEDIYRNELERKIVSGIDQVCNGEYWQHVYLTNKDWLSYFNKLNWKVKFAKQYSQFAFKVMYTRYGMYVLEKN